MGGVFGGGGTKLAKWAKPYVKQGLADAQNVFSENQDNIKHLGGIATDAFTQAAGDAYGPNPYVDNAKAAARTVSNGFFLGSNPGQSTYAGLMSPSGQGGVHSGGLPKPFRTTQSPTPNGTMAGLMSPGNNPGDAYAGATAGGKYLNAQPSAGLYGTVMSDDYLKGNPYLDAEIARTNESVATNANRMFGSRGMGSGISSAFADVLSKNLAENEGSLRYQNYNDAANRQLAAAGQSDAAFGNERGLMNSAAGLLSDNYNTGRQQQLAAAQSLGGLQLDQGNQRLAAAGAADSQRNTEVQQMLAALGLTGQLSDAQYAGYGPTTQLLNTAAAVPYVGLDAYQTALGNLAGQAKVTKGPGLGTTIAGGLASGAGAALVASDRRLKKNIAKVGALDDGLGVYEYEYTDERFGKGRFRGVMADEVAKLRPWALGPKIDGEFASVDYSKLEVA